MYGLLNEALAQDGMATRAHLTRRVAEGEGRLDVDHVLAAGLATMSTAEWQCLAQWNKRSGLTVMWDADASYVDDVHNEAGLFVRKHRGTDSAFPRATISTTPPAVRAVACSSTVSQTQYVRNLVASLSPDELDRTLVILPDGSSLGTLLQALPPQPNGINVTMGVALHETPVVSFVEHLFMMLETQGTGWRLEHVQALHAHPVMLHVAGPGPGRKQVSKAIHRLAKAHRNWVKSDDFLEQRAPKWAEELDGLSALKTAEATSFLDAMSSWAQALEQRMESLPQTLSEDMEDDQERAVPWIPAGWRRFRTVLAVLKRLQEAHAPMTHAKEVRAMVRRLLRQERVDLLGEPNQGLQIMGLTETRALDFDRIVVLDMNEGTVPQTSMPDSFLPLDLRHALHLPGPREREARYAYLVHRLMNRSKEIHLLYRGASDKKDGGEPSRYLMQLEGSYHKAQGEPYLTVEHVVHQLPLPDARPEIPELEVSDGMRTRLGEWSSQGMSPSAINTLLQCPRNFAYRYLYGMGQATEIQTAMEASTLGSVVHWVMEHGLAQVEGHVLQVHHLENVRLALDTLLEQALESEYNAALVKRGENVLQLEIARTTLLKLLRQEMKELADGSPAPHIVKLEQELTSTHPGTAAGTLGSEGLPTAGRKCMASLGWWTTNPAKSKPRSSSSKAPGRNNWKEETKARRCNSSSTPPWCWRRWGPKPKNTGSLPPSDQGATSERACSCSRSTASVSSSPTTPKPSSIGSPASWTLTWPKGTGLCTTPTPNTANIVSSWTRRSPFLSNSAPWASSPNNPHETAWPWSRGFCWARSTRCTSCPRPSRGLKKAGDCCGF